MKIYELWSSTGSYSDYSEHRLGFCSSQEELDKTVERFMSMKNIEQAGPQRKKEKLEDYMVMKHEDGHWTGRVIWYQYFHGLMEMKRGEEMEIWSNVMEVDEDLLKPYEGDHATYKIEYDEDIEYKKLL